VSPVRRSPSIGDRVRFAPRTGHGAEQLAAGIASGSEGVIRRVNDTLYGRWYDVKLDGRPGLEPFDDDDLVVA